MDTEHRTAVTLVFVVEAIALGLEAHVGPAGLLRSILPHVAGLRSKAQIELLLRADPKAGQFRPPGRRQFDPFALLRVVARERGSLSPSCRTSASQINFARERQATGIACRERQCSPAAATRVSLAAAGETG